MAWTMSDRQSQMSGARFRRGLNYAGGLIAIGLAYFALAKTGLTLASIHPSASPIWPPTGLALAAVLLCGYRIWPAIFLGAVIANVTTAGSVTTAVAIATGNTLEAVIGGFLIHWWSSGRDTFSTPYAIAKFTAICVVVATPISAAIGIGSLALAGFADWDKIPRIGFTWWMGDVTGALVVTPAIVLWAMRAFATSVATNC